MQRLSIVFAITLAIVSLALVFPQLAATFLPAFPSAEDSESRSAPSSSADTHHTTVLWSADMESSGPADTALNQWYRPGCCSSTEEGGGLFSSGSASVRTSVDINHTPGGRSSAMLTINTPSTPTSGIRLFRWFEPQTYPDLYYSVWFYFPRVYAPSGEPAWWNVFQWKSKHFVGTGFSVDPTFILNVGETVVRGQSALYFYLCPPPFDDIGRGLGQCVGQKAMRTFIPVKEWTRVEAHYVCASTTEGQVTFWEDGTEIFNFSGVATAYPNGDCQWSVNNYSNNLRPSPATIYVDDAAICSGDRCP